MKNKIFFIVSLFFSAASSAATWQISDVKQGTDGGFGFSSLHDGSGSNPMSGSKYTDIDSASGTYDDVSGAVNFIFTLANADVLTLTGNLLFDPAGWLNANSTLAYSGLDNLGSLASTGDFGYLPGDVCCGGSADPNSFKASGVGDTFFMTLWGADSFNVNGSGVDAYGNSTVGMDFRVELSQVPIPAALWLFGPALLGLTGLRRKANK